MMRLRPLGWTCTYDTDNRVHTRYYGSSFLGHGTNQNILAHFTDLTKELDDSHLFQISMDGPNVNLKNSIENFLQISKKITIILW